MVVLVRALPVVRWRIESLSHFVARFVQTSINFLARFGRIHFGLMERYARIAFELLRGLASLLAGAISLLTRPRVVALGATKKKQRAKCQYR